MISVFRKRGALLALLFAFALVVAACAEDDPAPTTTAPPATTLHRADDGARRRRAPPTTVAPTTLPPPPPGKEVLACQVSDIGGIDDASFNASAWAGAQRAEADLEGVTAEFLESADATEYRPNIDAFINQGCDLVVTVGFLMANDTADAAVENPNQLFAIVDGAPGPFAAMGRRRRHVLRSDIREPAWPDLPD